jgi:CAP-Gly domain-containing linker protein 3/4
MAVVKYIGRTDFGPGIWLGLELRQPKGKHDGMVEGRRYFTCKPNHGIMIRLKRFALYVFT